MAFRGIFVGVDRYASPDIGWLSCARRDAVALDALFRDTLGDGGLILVDEAATTENIWSALADLETSRWRIHGQIGQRSVPWGYPSSVYEYPSESVTLRG